MILNLRLTLICGLIVLVGSRTSFSREPHTAAASHGNSGGHTAAGHSGGGHTGGVISQPGLGNQGVGLSPGTHNSGFRSGLQPAMTTNTGVGMSPAQNFGSDQFWSSRKLIWFGTANWESDGGRNPTLRQFCPQSGNEQFRVHRDKWHTAVSRAESLNGFDDNTNVRYAGSHGQFRTLQR